jgi:hypothetical protein
MNIQPTRRKFIQLTVAAVGTSALPQVAAAASDRNSAAPPNSYKYRSTFFRIQMAADQPVPVNFALDSLGKAKFNANIMLDPLPAAQQYVISHQTDKIEYRLAAADSNNPAWVFEFSERVFTVRSNYVAKYPPQQLILGFTIDSHATLLGLFDDEGAIQLPALLHIPNQGTLRITSPQKNISLHYDAAHHNDNFIRITFPAATEQRTQVEYRFEATSIYPKINNADIAADPRYDGFRRDYLSMFQLNPRRRALANNVASDTCAFTVFEYSMMAIHLPPLANGFTATDMIRQTLDRYIEGMKAYGMVGYNDSPLIKYDFLDTYPSLVMASADYVTATRDSAWAKRNYPALKTWADTMAASDSDGDGLLEYPVSGNSGSWPQEMVVRPANWWDTIGFGHKDAYSNALAYKAFLGMEGIAQFAGYTSDAAIFHHRAERIKAVYYKTFYNPETCVLAGWKSTDGNLHDYYFLFVNGIAVTYGLVTHAQGNAIWDKLLSKMKEVGYNRFDLGLPGNLVPVRREDYADHNLRYGGSTKADGSDGFQIYENGGATACYAYYTIQALHDLGRVKEANAILYPMLKSFEDGRFQGRGPNGMTYDWTTWDGTPHGYEGLLVDGYLTLLAAISTSA